MIPPSSVTSPYRMVPSSDLDPAPASAGSSPDPTQEKDPNFDDLIDQHELGKSDPLPREGPDAVPDPSRQAALAEWPWPMVRWILPAPSPATPDPVSAQSEEEIIPPPLLREAGDRTGRNGAVGSALPRQPELAANGVSAASPAPPIPSDASLPGTPSTGTKGRISESCKQEEQSSRLFVPRLSQRDAEPHTGETPMLPGHPAPVAIFGEAPGTKCAPFPLHVAENGISLRPAIPQSDTQLKQPEPASSGVSTASPAPPLPSAACLPGTPPTGTKDDLFPPRAAENGIDLRPAMPQADALPRQAEPAANRVSTASPTPPHPLAAIDTPADQKPAPAAQEVAPATQLKKDQPGPGAAPNVTNINQSRASILPLSDAKTLPQDAASPSRTSAKLVPFGTSHQAGNAAAVSQEGNGLPPATVAFEPGDAKRRPPTSARPDGPEAMPTAAAIEDEPAGNSLASLTPGSLRESQATGFAPARSPARIGEPAPDSGEISKPTPASPRGPEHPSLIAVPSAAAGLAGPAGRNPEAGRVDLSPLIEKVWEAAETLASAQRGRVDLDLPLRDTETVRIRVELRSGEIHATIRTDSPELRDALEKSWPDFAGKTGDRGFKLADANFSSLRQDAGAWPGGQGSRRDHPAEQNSWQHRQGDQPSHGGGQARPQSTEAVPSHKPPAPVGPMTLWA